MKLPESTEVITVDKETGAPVLRTIPYPLPRYNIGDNVEVFRYNKTSSYTINKIEMRIVSSFADPKQAVTYILYTSVADAIFNENDIVKLNTKGGT